MASRKTLRALLHLEPRESILATSGVAAIIPIDLQGNICDRGRSRIEQAS